MLPARNSHEQEYPTEVDAKRSESKKCPISVEKSRSPHPTSFLAGRAQERHKDPELRKHAQDARDILQAVNESGWRHNLGTNNPIPASHSRNLRFPTLFHRDFPATVSHASPRRLPTLPHGDFSAASASAPSRSRILKNRILGEMVVFNTKKRLAPVKKLELRGNGAIKTRKRPILVKNLELRGRLVSCEFCELRLWKHLQFKTTKNQRKSRFPLCFRPSIPIS